MESLLSEGAVLLIIIGGYWGVILVSALGEYHLGRRKNLGRGNVLDLIVVARSC